MVHDPNRVISYYSTYSRINGAALKNDLTRNNFTYDKSLKKWVNPNGDALTIYEAAHIKGYGTTKANNQGVRATAYNLVGGFNNLGIDISKAKFIEDGDIPFQPKADPRLKSPNIPIFLLQDDSSPNSHQVVYAKGVNDYEQYQGQNLGRTPMSTLLKWCKAFCYVDSSDPDNLYSKQELTRRKEYTNYMKDAIISGQERDPSIASQWGEHPENWLGKGQKNSYSPYVSAFKDFDKSGYVVDPKKYITKLQQSGMFNYAKKVKKYYDQIQDLKQDMLNIIKYHDMSQDNLDKDIMVTVISLYNRIGSSYRSLLNHIDNVSAGSQQLNNYYFDSLEYNIDRLSKTLDSGEFSTSVVDW